jgi:2-polyprenyl-3-methyl-5-hydroxy-6-metoxy-1,4-benzoquinol methylase
MPKLDPSEKFWDRIANLYEKQPIKDEQAFLHTIENINKYLKSSDIVLDFACGTGTNSIEIADNVKEIHAIDISSKMLTHAKRKVDIRKIKNIYFSKIMIYEESLNEQQFDVILAFNILHLLEDIPNIIQRINKLLKPGGLLISTTACMGEKKAFLSFFMLLLSKLGIIPYLNFLKTSELEALIANRNFQIIETDHLPHSPSNYFIVAKKV